MGALLFLLLSAWVGWRVVDRLLARRIEDALAQSLRGTTPPLAAWMVAAPAAVVIGLVMLTWAAYLGAYVAAGTKDPLRWGNATALAVGLLWLWWSRGRREGLVVRLNPWEWLRLYRWEALSGAVLLAVSAWLMFASLRLRDANTVEVGLSVFSDFGPHLAVIRSFSLGANFPTQYPHFPAGDIRYHFMFQFLAGNLEYLGLPLDWAFNLPSLIGVMACGVLLYALTVLVTGHRGAGILAVIFFGFRSSPAFLDFWKGAKSVQEGWGKFWTNEQFIGRTQHEDWGLWNQNVYLNQRHLPFGLAVLLLLLILVYPALRDAWLRREGAPAGWKGFLFSKASWLPKEGLDGWKAASVSGLLLGACCYWNGAVVVVTLLLLFLFALIARYRLEFLVIAVLTAVLGKAENRLFLGPGAVPLKLEFTYGFLAERPITWKSVATFHADLLGVLPWAVVASLGWFLGLALWARLGRAGPAKLAGVTWLVLVFASPLVLANTVQLTPEIGINHKYIMMAVILLNMIVAGWLWDCWLTVRWVGKPLVVGVALAMTLTGLIDFRTIVNRNRPEKALVAKFDDPLFLWVKLATQRQAVFLTDWYSTHPVLLAGRKIFYGWPYYAWSAGYDTLGREAIVKRIYGATAVAEAQQLAKEHKIDYVIIDNENRRQSLYKLQETVLREAFHVAYARDDVVVLKVGP